MEPINNQDPNIVKDKIPVKTVQDAMSKPIVPGFQYSGSGIAPVYVLNSLNFASNSQGWGLGSNGDSQFNGNHMLNGHFTPVLRLLGVTVYISDLTSPNGTLSGASGDLCLKGDSGKIYYCVGGTTWVAPT